MRNYTIPLEGHCVVEVEKTPDGLEIQKVKNAFIYLLDVNAKHSVGLRLSDFRDTAGRSLEDVIADQSVPLHQMLDEEIEKEKAETSWP